MPSVVVLAGGVGGAKMASGLYAVLERQRLTCIVNTGDDFEHFGLRICPDLDTVMYTLAGLANPETGWGIAGDTFHNMEMLGRYGGPIWFHLGDHDIATHIRRTQLLRQGQSLTQVTAELTRALGIAARLVPMVDEPVATIVETPEGPLPFQEYFVHRRAQDRVISLRFEGAAEARPTQEVRAALAQADAIVIAPSNPLLSIAPILAVSGMRELICSAPGVKVAVSPIVGGKALRGPADRIMADMGHEPSPLGVAKLYLDMIDVVVFDRQDAALRSPIERLGLRVLITDTVMHSQQDKARLAREILEFALREKWRAPIAGPSSQ